MLLDLSHTSHTRARTGIQRVARSLWRSLGGDARPICHDPYLGAWRPLEAWELANLSAEAPSASRGARWPWRIRIRKLLRRRTSPVRLDPSELGQGLLTPEIFSPGVAAALGPLLGAVRGPRAAVFFDAIPLQLPQLTPPKTVARFPAYLHQLLAFDGIAAISEDSRSALVDYWSWLGVKSAPPVAAIPLAFEPDPGHAGPEPAPSDPPTVLCVGSIEGRKNHAALLDACESLWERGVRFELRLIGIAQAQTASAAIGRISTLKGKGRPVRYDGPVGEAELESAYRQCLFTVYPSLSEGFGLPVLESVAHGKPCVCSGRGALGEAARDGGCLTLDDLGADSLASGIARMLGDPAAREALAAAARRRKFKTWSGYAREIADWMSGLERRPSDPEKLAGPGSG
jgi:glycosyltransferase involved in cell wall biosynthesis